MNEKLKGVSSIFFNLGAATIAAAAARTVTAGYVDLPGAGWTVGAFVLIWMGSKLLDLMESEN